MHVGKQCAKADCKQLDFLPVNCTHCRLDFCELHYQPDSHSCQNHEFNMLVARPAAATPVRCNVCSATALIDFQCAGCRGTFCAAHRHDSSHNCPELIRRTAMEKGASAQPSRLAEMVANFGNRVAETSKRKAKKPLPAKMALMKLKSISKPASTHCKQLAADDRFFARVLYWCEKEPTPAANNKMPLSDCLFVDKQYSVGKCIDVFADALNVHNENDRRSDFVLKLALLSDGRLLNNSSRLDELLFRSELSQPADLALCRLDCSVDRLSEHVVQLLGQLLFLKHGF